MESSALKATLAATIARQTLHLGPKKTAHERIIQDWQCSWVDRLGTIRVAVPSLSTQP